MRHLSGALEFAGQLAWFLGAGVLPVVCVAYMAAMLYLAFIEWLAG